MSLNLHVYLKNDLVLHFPALEIWSVIFQVMRLTGLAFSVAQVAT